MTAPRWTAVDGDTRAHLYDDGPGALVLVVEAEHATLTVRLPDAALRRGALAVGGYLIERAHLGAVRDGALRDDLALLTAGLDDTPDDGLCHDPHPTRRGRSCTEPAGHAGPDLRGASHGDGHVDRWLRR